MAETTTDARKLPFARSLAGRLVLLGILPGATVLVALVGWVLVEKFNSLERLAKAELEHEALYVAARVGESNEAAMRLARSIAATQESGLFGDRAKTVGMLRSILASDEGITAAYVAYEPNADGKDAMSASSDPKEWMDASGRFIPYPFRDWRNGDAIAVKPLTDYDAGLYYDGARRAFAESGKATTIVTEPYLYEGQLLVEQTHPIVIDGKFRGIGGVDRALASIDGVVRAAAAEVGASAYLVSSRGRFIVATDDAPIASAGASVGDGLRTKTVAGSSVAALVEPFLREADTRGFLGAGIDPRSGEEHLVASIRIASGGWTLVCTKPREVVVGPIRSEVLFSGAVFFCGLGLSAALVVAIAVRMGRRVRSAAIAADAIAAGDLRCQIEESGAEDEAGILLRSLGRMKDGLHQLLTGVKTAGVTIDSGAVELAASSREQGAVAQRFGESSAQIASATRQISATGAELARTMSDVDDAVEHTAKLGESARGNLASVDATIRELSDASASIAAKLAAISARAASINSVVTTITKVADQTNLLSVNAAIEAEKAGEQGRGFLVVAREIRRLADQTAGATGDIEAIVGEMQSAVGAGVMEMDRFADKVRRGVEEVVASTREMNEIIAQVEANAVRFGKVSDGMASQSQGAATISDSMGALAEAARRAVESAEEFGRTAAELERASQILRQSVGAFRLS